jgi:hypothetical protein
VPKAARAYINSVIAAGLAIAASAVLRWNSQSPIRFTLFLALFAAAALLKGRIPGITGTYSPVFFFVLVGSRVLSFSEVVFAAGLAGIVQCTFLVQRYPSPIQVVFNAANMMISTACAFAFIHQGAAVSQIPGFSDQPLIILLILGASVYYAVNTGLVSVVLTLVESKPLSDIWGHWCLWSLPYYIVGALIAAATLSAQNHLSLWVVGMVCPSVLLATVYYRFWLKSITRLNALNQ